MGNDGSQEGNGVLFWQVVGPIWRPSPYNKKEILGLNIDMLDSKNEFGTHLFGIRSFAHILIQGAQALKGLPSESPSTGDGVTWWSNANWRIMFNTLTGNPGSGFSPQSFKFSSNPTQPTPAGKNHPTPAVLANGVTIPSSTFYQGLDVEHSNLPRRVEHLGHRCSKKQ